MDEISADWLLVVGWLQPVRDSLLQFPGFSEEEENVPQMSLPLPLCSQHGVAGACTGAMCTPLPLDHSELDCE